MLMGLCAADNQTLLVTRGDAAVSVNDTGADGLLDLPPDFYPPEDLLRIGVQLYTVDSNETVDDLCSTLKEWDPTVITCEGDVAAGITQANATDDPLITQQSNLDMIKLQDAWAKGYVGDPAVRVCVVDSDEYPYTLFLLLAACSFPVAHLKLSAQLFWVLRSM